jgi:Histidine kinase-, DNA gyrase B-, and HSP90-like ATPase
MRRMRERRRVSVADPLLFERADWRLFIDPRTLPQKAGCEPSQLGWVVAKELTDNALDAGAENVTMSGDPRSIIVRDDGPGIAPDKIATLFSVNRPLLSSKLKRLPTRGMLGNGLRVVMGAVIAFDGAISVTTRGQRYELSSEQRNRRHRDQSDHPGARCQWNHGRDLFPAGILYRNRFK